MRDQFNKTRKQSNKHILCTGIIAAFAMAIPVHVFAQGFVLEEVVVTARKRAENLQEVPDSITAFGRDQIESAGIEGFDDFANLTPNRSLNEGYRPGVAKITIRGMITPQVGDPPIAYVVDGVTASSIDFINQDLFAIERIEVLRGPQGALYGKGAVGGAINIVTRRPTNELEGKIKATLGNGDTTKVSGFISGPIIEDSLQYQLGGSYTDAGGFDDNAFLNKATDFSERTSIQGMLQAQVNNDLTVDFRAKYASNEDGAGNYTVAGWDDINADKDVGGIDANANIMGTSDRDILEFSVKADLASDLGDATFILGYSEVDEEVFSDGDYTNMASNFVDFFAGAQGTNFQSESLTAEFRFTGNSDVVVWQVGAFYQNRKTNSQFNWFSDFVETSERRSDSFQVVKSEYDLATSATYFDTDFGTEYAYSIVDENSSDAWAVFGQFDYAINVDWSIAFALRYDEDKRESFDERQKELTKASDTFSEVQPKLQISYQLTDNTMTYLSTSRGFRSGGFNEFDPTILRGFDKEVSENIELGFKSTLWDGAMILTGAVFNIDSENTQFTRLNLASFTLENLGIDESTSQGLEIEALIQPSEGLRFNLGYGYVDAQIDEFTATADYGDITGNNVPGVHKYSVNLGVEYVATVSDQMDIIMRADYIRKGPLSWELDNVIESGTSDLVNLRAGIEKDGYTVTLFVKNATDERVATEAFFGATGIARLPNMPRFYGVEASYNF